MAQTVKHLPPVQETVQCLDWEDPLEKKMATHSSTLAWKIPWMEEPGRLQSMGSQRVRHDWVTSLHLIMSDDEHLFMGLLAIWISSMEKWNVYFSLLSIGLFVSFYQAMWTVLCILENNPLSVTSFSNIFSHSIGCLFIFFKGFLCCKERRKVKLLSRVQLFVTPWTVVYQAPLSMGFSRQEYWSGLPFPSLGDLPDPGIRIWASHIVGRCFTVWAM